jgi:hypothetical protein
MGFHAPQETARILGESIDYARQGQIEAIKVTPGAKLPPAPAASTSQPAGVTETGKSPKGSDSHQ